VSGGSGLFASAGYGVGADGFGVAKTVTQVLMPKNITHNETTPRETGRRTKREL